MEQEKLDDLITEAMIRIAEVYEPDVWGPKRRVEPFMARLGAVESELRALVAKVLEHER